VRSLADVAGVSVGSAQTAISVLTSQGYLLGDGRSRRLAGGGELLDHWVEAYALRLEPRLALSRFSAEEPQWWRGAESELKAADALLGGEAAASIIDPNLNPTTTTLYAAQVPVAILKRHRMRRDENGDVLIRRKFWKGPEPTTRLVPTPLTYADLLTSGDPRERDHAIQLRASDAGLSHLDRL
jgi:hypothetical protein